MSDTKPTPPKTEFPEAAEFDLSGFTCPRCEKTVSAEYYGPCPNCIAELESTQRRDDADGSTEAAAFEPKMNVTPNAVALKE